MFVAVVVRKAVASGGGGGRTRTHGRPDGVGSYSLVDAAGYVAVVWFSDIHSWLTASASLATMAAGDSNILLVHGWRQLPFRCPLKYRLGGLAPLAHVSGKTDLAVIWHEESTIVTQLR